MMNAVDDKDRGHKDAIMSKVAPNLMSASYGDVLAFEQKTNPAARKGERKRESLMASTATMLNKTSYHQLRISDICDHANTSSASFYLYFENKKHVTLQVLNMFSERLYDDLRQYRTEGNRSDYQAIYDANLAWLKIVRYNCGLMRCVLQVSFEDENFIQNYRKVSFDYNKLVAQRMIQRMSKSTIDENKLILKVFAYSAMTDEFTRRLIEGDETNFSELVEQTYGSDEELATFLSELWYKSIFE